MRISSRIQDKGTTEVLKKRALVTTLSSNINRICFYPLYKGVRLHCHLLIFLAPIIECHRYCWEMARVSFVRLLCLFALFLSLTDFATARHHHESKALRDSKLLAYPHPKFTGKLHRSMFPKDFIFGSAGSSYQVPNFIF